MNRRAEAGGHLYPPMGRRMPVGKVLATLQGREPEPAAGLSCAGKDWPMVGSMGESVTKIGRAHV